MPFTVAHAAAALPLRRFNLIWSAFVMGSFAPDFPYVIGNTRYRDLGHGWPGVLLFTLPASLAALWLFHAALKEPAVGLFPLGFQQRLRGSMGRFRFGGFRRFAAIIFSLSLGIAVHLIWDAFTHSHTWPWRHSAWLQSRVHLPVAGWTPMFEVLQYASTLVGFAALFVWVVLWYRDSSVSASVEPVGGKSRFALAMFIFGAAGVAGLARAVAAGMSASGPSWDFFMMRFAVTSLAVAFWALLVYCLLATAAAPSRTSLPAAGRGCAVEADP